MIHEIWTRLDRPTFGQVAKLRRSTAYILEAGVAKLTYESLILRRRQASWVVLPAVATMLSDVRF